MNKILELGRKAMFYVRVLSGYEERKIRAYRMQLQERMAKAQSKKAELRLIPEKVILSEFRRVVEEMQELNRSLKNTETAIDEFLKPLDKSAHMIVDMQLENEEKRSKEMIKAMRAQSVLNNDMAQRLATRNSDEMNTENLSNQSQDTTSPSKEEHAK